MTLDQEHGLYISGSHLNLPENRDQSKRNSPKIQFMDSSHSKIEAKLGRVEQPVLFQGASNLPYCSNRILWLTSLVGLLLVFERRIRLDHDLLSFFGTHHIW